MNTLEGDKLALGKERAKLAKLEKERTALAKEKGTLEKERAALEQEKAALTEQLSAARKHAEALRSSTAARGGQAAANLTRYGQLQSFGQHCIQSVHPRSPRSISARWSYAQKAIRCAAVESTVVVGLVSEVQTCCSASYEAARRRRSNVSSEGRQCFCRTLEDIAAAEKGLAAMREKLSGLAAELQGVLVPASS